MKTIILLSGLLLALSNCASYQLFETNSSALPKAENGLYLFENEELSIVYDFWSEAGIPVIRLTNLSKETIYFAFHKSELAINKKSYNYYNPLPTEYGTFPPVVESPQVALVPGEILDLETYPILLGWSKLSKKSYSLQFKEKHSPFIIQNNLYYSIGKLDGELKGLQHQFWVSALSRIKPKEFKEVSLPLAANADKFYLRKDNSQFWMDLLIETSVGVLPLLFAF